MPFERMKVFLAKNCPNFSKYENFQIFRQNEPENWGAKDIFFQKKTFDTPSTTNFPP